MSGWPRVIEDMMGDKTHVVPDFDCVVVRFHVGDDSMAMVLTVDQCAALIAAITDAARVVTGEGK